MQVTWSQNVRFSTLYPYLLQITRLLEPVKAIQVRKPKTLVIGQCDGNRVIMDGDEFERAVVINHG
jgi:hypothetical protein